MRPLASVLTYIQLLAIPFVFQLVKAAPAPQPASVATDCSNPFTIEASPRFIEERTEVSLTEACTRAFGASDYEDCATIDDALACGDLFIELYEKYFEPCRGNSKGC